MDEQKLITQEDLDANPVLVEQGFVVGDIYPEEEAVAEEVAEDDTADEAPAEEEVAA